MMHRLWGPENESFIGFSRKNCSSPQRQIQGEAMGAIANTRTYTNTFTRTNTFTCTHIYKKINRKLRVATKIGTTHFWFLTSNRAAEIVQSD
jgi:hypothetical protein